MKIEDVINVMDDVSETIDLEGVHQAAAELYEAMKALEQHHKDLMGLVSKWRLHGPYMQGKHARLRSDIECANNCADDLESLINPKD